MALPGTLNDRWFQAFTLDAGSNPALNVVLAGGTLAGALLLVDGTGAAPGLAFASQAGLGLWRQGANDLRIGGTGANMDIIFQNSTGNIFGINSTSAELNVSNTGSLFWLSGFGPAITQATGTGITVNQQGEVRRTIYKTTTTNAAFPQGTKLGDLTIATLPAKTRLVGVICDATQSFNGGGETTATLQLGKTAGGSEYLVAFTVFAVTPTKGLADADLGASLTRATAIQGGDLPSWTATTAVTARLTTTTNNISGLTQGSATWYLITEVHP